MKTSSTKCGRCAIIMPNKFDFPERIMIYTLTLNPSLDYVMQTERLVSGAVNRSTGESISFGGKGINVSAVLLELGVDSVALGFAGGFTGDELLRMMDTRGIVNDFVRLGTGLTRVNVKLVGDGATEINGAGPEITEADMTALYERLNRLAEGDTLVLAGSIPPSLPADTYERILDRLDGRGIRVAGDASGDLLTGALKHRPFLIKPNIDELTGIAGVPLETEDDVIREAKELQAMGAVNVLVSLGKDGAILLDENGNIHKRCAFAGHERNAVGAGDSAVAGFLAGVDEGYDRALLLACAAGAATAFSDSLATREEIFKLIGEGI